MATKKFLKELGTDIANTKLEFLPTSNSTKPMHIANGFFRACTGEVCNVQDIHEWVISERRTDGKAITSEDLKEKYVDILEYGADENSDNIKEVRFLLEKVFNPDATVYPSYANSVLNISSHWLIKDRIDSEARIGDFIYNILAVPKDGQVSRVIELTQRALKNDKDDITRLIKPILGAKVIQEERQTKTEKDFVEIDMNFSKGVIRDGYDAIAENMIFMEQANNSLLFLKRIINYATFATVFYLIDVNHAMYNAVRVPLLLDSGIGLSAIEAASEECYKSGKKEVENFYINCIKERLSSEIVNHNSEEECMSYIEKSPFDETNEKKDERGLVKRYFSAYVQSGDLPIDALAKALQMALYTFTYSNNTPSDFCRVCGGRSGLVGPKGNAATKRLLIDRFLLETIALSVVSPQELENGMEFKEFGKRLREKYNIIIGTDVELEYELLENANIAQLVPGDLRGELANNAKGIADMLNSMNLAKRYADGVTIIGWRLQ
jgi:hypothetical protein